MEITNRSFTAAEMTLLKKTKGAKLLSMDAVFAAPPDNAWNTVRMHFEGFDIDVNNTLGEIIVDEFGTIEEFGLMSITKSTPETLDIPEVGADTTVLQINQIIEDVSVISDIIDIYGEGVHVSKLEYPQAIAFKTRQEVIMLDKEVWFSEMIVIKDGKEIKDMLYDESVNWEDNPEEDPTTHYEFRVEAEEL